MRDSNVDVDTDDTWCTGKATNVAITAGSAIDTEPKCFGYDNQFNPVSFNPPIATATTVCDDPPTTWHYDVSQTPVNGDIETIKLSIDSANSIFYVKGLTGGTRFDEFTVTVKATLSYTR